MSVQPRMYLTPEEYLILERQTETKNEYYDGEIYAMAGTSRQHVRISVNITVSLGTQLRGGPCEIFSGDMRVKVSPTGLYTYPDVTVVCGEPRFEDREMDTLLNPKVIFEILSKSTEAYDRGEKFAQYRTLDTLAEYVLISQDKALIEHFVRKSAGEWTFSATEGLDAVAVVRSLQCHLPLAEVYDRVEFDLDADPPKLTRVKAEVAEYDSSIC